MMIDGEVPDHSFLKTFSIPCPNCKFGLHFINAEHLDPDFYREYNGRLKILVSELKRRVDEYEWFLTTHDLPFGIGYELKNLLRKYGRNEK